MNKTRRLSRLLILLPPVILSIIGSAFAQTNSPVLEVPFNFDSNEIVVLAMINNEGPYRMLLDTGSTVTFVDRGLAKNLALKQGKKSNTAVGYNSREKVYPTNLSSVRLGPIAASDVEAFVSDMTADQAEGFEKIEGVLGHSFLKNRIVEIDYPNRVIRFHTQMPFVSPDDMKFSFHDELVIDDVRINGHRIDTEIDTGLDSRFQLLPRTIKALKLQNEHYGKAKFPVITLDSVTLGTLSLRSVSVLNLANSNKAADREKSSPGFYIGNGFLKRYVLIVDYPGGVVILRSPPSMEKP